MSYYFKSKDGKVISDSTPGAPIKQVLTVEKNSFHYPPNKDVRGEYPTATGHNYWAADSSQGVTAWSQGMPSYCYPVPYVAIKDASVPFYFVLNKDYRCIDDFKPGIDQEPDYHRLIAVCSYKSRDNTYDLTTVEPGDKPTMYMPIMVSHIKQKELICKKQNLYSICDRTKGNVLVYKPKNAQWLNSRWNSKWGPFKSDVEAVDPTDTCLRAYMDFVNDNYSSCGGYLYSDMNIGDKKLVYFKRNFTSTDNTMFGFTEYSPVEGYNPTTHISYFRLNVTGDDGIKAKGNKLRLKYYWTYIINDPATMDTAKDTYIASDKPFVFNYSASDNETWTGNLNNGFILGQNIKSSLKYENGVPINDCECTNQRYEIKHNVPSGKDVWGDSETYKNLYVTYVNPGDNSSEQSILKLNIPNYGYTYIGSGSITRANLGRYNSNNKLPVDITKDKRYVVEDTNDKYQFAVATANYSSGTIITSNMFSAFTDVTAYALKNLTADPANYENYSAHFTKDCFLSAQNNWSNYSANFLPYLRTNNNDCIFNTDETPQYFGQFTTENSNRLVYKLWGRGTSYGTYNCGIREWKLIDSNDLKDNSIYAIKNDTNNLYKFKKHYYYCDNTGPYGTDETVGVGDIIRIKSYDETTQETSYHYCVAKETYVQTYFDYYSVISSHYNTIPGITNDDEFYSYMTNTANGVMEYDYSIPSFDSTKSYSRGDKVRAGTAVYSARCAFGSGTTFNQACWNEGLFDINKYYADDLNATNTTYNYVGSASYDIDLTNENSKYLFVAYPSTTLLNNTITEFTIGKCDVIITDFKMVYEAVD